MLVYLGVRSLIRRHGDELESAATATATRSQSRRSAFRDGLATSLANPKLAVFFVALFPQFVAEGSAVLPPALGMAALIVLLDLAWYSTSPCWSDRSRRALMRSRLMARLERLMGVVLIGLGVRVALEQR